MSLSLFRGGQNDKRFRRLSVCGKKEKKKCGKNWGLSCVQLVEPPAPSGQPARHAADEKKRKKGRKKSSSGLFTFFLVFGSPSTTKHFFKHNKTKNDGKKRRRERLEDDEMPTVPHR